MQRDILNKLYTDKNPHNKFDKVVRHIKAVDEWHMNTFPINPQGSLLHLLNSGIIYFNKRDASFRPIMVISVRKLVDFGKTP
jgi:hypothetical protein